MADQMIQNRQILMPMILKVSSVRMVPISHNPAPMRNNATISPFILALTLLERLPDKYEIEYDNLYSRYSIEFLDEVDSHCFCPHSISPKSVVGL